MVKTSNRSRLKQRAHVHCFRCLKQSSACLKHTFVLGKSSLNDLLEILSGGFSHSSHSDKISRCVWDNTPWRWMKLWHNKSRASSWEMLDRGGKGLHSSRPGCVLADMTRLHKILWVVSSQWTVSKHAASVCLLPCLSLRPQPAHISQSEVSQ